jgi:hypothetical protein
MPARPRRPWLIGALVLLAVAVAGGILAGALGSRDDGSRTSARAHPTVPPTGAPHEPDAIPEAGRSADERAAMRAARRFLAGYLPYSYGRGSADRIEATAAPLASMLRRQPPRVPAADRQLHPQLVSLEVASVNGDLGLDLEAVIDDGRRRYSMIVAVRPAGERWLVTALS